MPLDGALGELSPFNAAFGFYVHGVSIETATLPRGWKDRTISVSDEIGTRGNTGHCLEAHDLAASKLAAYRDKERDFVRVLLSEGMTDPAVLRQRIGELGLADEESARLTAWVDRTVSELHLP